MNTQTTANLTHVFENLTYAPRIATDILFEDAPTAVSFTGEADRAARFIEGFQLLNRELWALFTEQFRTRPDHLDTGWRGEYWGKMMRGACWTYKYTRNPELYAVLRETVLDMISTADADGRISSYQREYEFTGWDMWCRKYILLGLQYFCDITDEAELRERLVAVMCRHADYIISKIGDGEGKINILTTTNYWGGMNSASILEPFVRLYNITKEKKYLDFAEYIIGTGGCEWGNVFEIALAGEKMPYEYPVTKAYETMSFFEGVIEYYRVTGDDRCRTAFLNFIDGVIKTDLTVIGCCGCTHELFDNSANMQTEPSEQVMQETCVSVTWMKTLYQALCLTGDAKYADAIEKTYYNAMLGSVNFNKNVYPGTNDKNSPNPNFKETEEFMKALGGLPFDSYSPLYKSVRNRLVGGYKVMAGGTAYGCCACIGSAGTALLPVSAVMLTKDGIAINHYMSGTVTTLTPSGEQITVKMSTEYPYADTVNITWKTSGEPVTLLLRIPAFAASASVDGQDIRPESSGYYKMAIAGEGAITLTLSMPLVTLQLNGKISVSRGAITYALDERNQDVNAGACKEITEYSECEKDFECRSAIKATFANGNTLKLTDYASAGAMWNEPAATVTAWIDAK
ncbi:MAG: glycoside hydrolase family 127 protein [Clostridia bacterium]|nr:glycoside hydrolase family 127 protein [Clostridia bacterium]